MIQSKDTLSQLFVKGNDYGTEEWCKQLLQNTTSKKLDIVDAFAGVIKFPSDDFLDHNLNQHQTTQFQNSYYVGYMDLLLPHVDGSAGQAGFTKLQFKLDGVIRTFIQVNGGNDVNTAGLKFKDFILSANQSLSPNPDLCFIRNGMHVLTDIQISGSYYHTVAGVFTPITAGTFTPSIQFEICVSGYKCILL